MGTSSLQTSRKNSKLGAFYNKILVKLVFTLLSLFYFNTSYAVPEYVSRNSQEVNLSYFLGEPLGWGNEGITNLLKLEYNNRQMLLLSNVNRINRPFYADIGLSYQMQRNLEGTIDIISGRFYEIIPEENKFSDLVLQGEFYAGMPFRQSPKWRWDAIIGTQYRLFHGEIAPQFFTRAIFSYKDKSKDIPYQIGLFFGPQTRPLGQSVASFLVGGYALISETENTMTNVFFHTGWSTAIDLFKNNASLGLAQTNSFFKRKLIFRNALTINTRKVNEETYIVGIGKEASRSRYTDILAESALMGVLPQNTRLSLSGKMALYHTPDGSIVRWYRPVSPEVYFTARTQLAVFEFLANFGLRWVPNVGSESETSSGWGMVDDSSYGWVLNTSLIGRF